MKSLRAAGACGLAAVAIATAVSACSSSTVRPRSLCAHITSIRGAEVTRVGTPPDKHWTFPLPAHVAITDVEQSRQLASMLCALPRFNPVLYHCPVDFFVGYQISFTGIRTRVHVDPFGCQTVSGAGPLRWVARSPMFWPPLGRMMGVPGASVLSFQGHRS